MSCNDDLLPANVKVHLALGFIDMRKGIDGPTQGSIHRQPVRVPGAPPGQLFQNYLLARYRVLAVHSVKPDEILSLPPLSCRI